MNKYTPGDIDQARVEPPWYNARQMVGCMSKIIERWCTKREDQGAYAAFAGFEDEIRSIDGLREAYDGMGIYDQIALFGWVSRLLEEESEEAGKVKLVAGEVR